MAEYNDIPSNSHKSKQAETAGENKKPAAPVFQGETAGAKRKQENAVWKWFKRLFLSDRSPKDIAKEVFEQNIVPGLQDNFRNGAVAMLDGVIYKGARPGNAGTGNTVNYNKIFSGSSNKPAASSSQPTTSRQQTEEINKGFNNPCFKTQAKAAEFLGLMKSYDYPTLSVHTLYMMQSKHIDYTWDAYGWNREEILALTPSCIHHISNPDWPWMIELPEAHVIA